MNEHLNSSNNKSNFNEYLHNKVLNIPVSGDIPLLNNIEDNQQSIEDTQVEKTPDDLSGFEMIIYSLPAFSKMAALVIFK